MRIELGPLFCIKPRPSQTKSISAASMAVGQDKPVKYVLGVKSQARTNRMPFIETFRDFKKYTGQNIILRMVHDRRQP